MYNAGCAGRVHPSLSFDLSVLEESDDVVQMGVIGCGDEFPCAVGLGDTLGKICDGSRGGGIHPWLSSDVSVLDDESDDV